MNIILVSTVILLDKENKFLMERHKITNTINNLWKFPGGKVEPNELISQAAVRELKEELNISISSYDLRPLSFIDYVINKRQYIIFYFLCKTWYGNICNKEDQVLKWFSIGEANKVDIIGYNKLALQRLSEVLKNN